MDRNAGEIVDHVQGVGRLLQKPAFRRLTSQDERNVRASGSYLCKIICIGLALVRLVSGLSLPRKTDEIREPGLGIPQTVPFLPEARTN